MSNRTYQYDNFEDEYEDEWMDYERQRRFTNPNLSRGGKFSNLNKGGKISDPNHGRKGGYISPNEYKMKIEIPSFSKNLDIESFLD